MGEFVNARYTQVLAWIAAGIIVILNLKLLCDVFGITGLVLKH
jgi:Mn2+/Fe2+ NRAMP family transporter